MDVLADLNPDPNPAVSSFLGLVVLKLDRLSRSNKPIARTLPCYELQRRSSAPRPFSVVIAVGPFGPSLRPGRLRRRRDDPE